MAIVRPCGRGKVVGGGILLLSAIAPLAGVAVPVWGAGMIEGVLRNYTTGETVPHRSVILQKVGETEELGAWQTMTDGRGRFRFEGVEIDTLVFYYVFADYEGGSYSSAPLELAATAPRATIELAVYSSSPDPEGVTIPVHHIIIDDAGEAVVVSEYIQLMNVSETSYMGEADAPLEGIGFRQRLPSGHHGLEVMDGLMECCLGFEGDDLVETMAITPGYRDVAFRYRLGKSSTLDFSRPVIFPTRAFHVMVEEGVGEVAAPGLEMRGASTVRGVSYTTYVGADLEAGHEIGVRLTLTRGRPVRALVWIIVGLAVVVGPAVMIRLTRGRRERTGGSETPPRRHPVGEESVGEAYRYLISVLDEALGDGMIEPKAHRRVRAELEAKLDELLPEEEDR
ncbi:hypothetical protein AMJ39_03670 [candidate division TA06 bacterium DG_24]|uniref:Carboxypeptidase regulatory-like domain-containing protein n=2 Tax=Bacteria division TA06 TaxID=1156500 RepID=A0A0S8G572_UNCT6|nr:MAG: hypothetical protein AMJ39_03670 [candidate division TA06 bacterium DG_24]KPK68127.1 MAG: hypothetical protein AMJ82_09000 [candidate division TA06 bacterium SM23_40]